MAVQMLPKQAGGQEAGHAGLGRRKGKGSRVGYAGDTAAPPTQ